MSSLTSLFFVSRGEKFMDEILKRKCELCSKDLKSENEDEDHIIVNINVGTFVRKKAICDDCLDKIVDKLSERANSIGKAVSKALEKE